MRREAHTAKEGVWAAYLLAGFVVLAPQFLGGATASTHLTILSLGALVTACCAFAFRGSAGRLGSVPFAAYGAMLAAAWTLAQALPLPCSWLGWAQPERTLVGQSLTALGMLDAPSCSLSLSPGSTWVALSLAAALPGLILSATIATRAGHRRVIVVGVGLGSLAMACVALAHAVVDAQSVFGLYTPTYARGQLLLAPLMNPNHLAGHIALGLPVCIALAQTSEGADSRMMWWAASAVAFLGGLLSLSRAGAAVLIAGSGAYLVLDFRARRGRGMSLRSTLLFVAGAASCTALGVYFAMDLIARQFTAVESPWHKVRVALKLGELAWGHPWAGIGRGALGDVSARAVLKNSRFLFAENIAIQWVLEWGFPMALAIAGLFLASFVRLRLPQRSERALGCGLIALIVQNLLDFSLELAGVACVAAAAVGILVAREEEERIRLPSIRRLRARTTLVGAALAAIACLALTAPWQTTWARAELQTGIQTKLRDGAPAGEIKPLLRRAFVGHPLDPTFLVLASALAVRDQDPASPKWLNLAFEAAPGWAGPHLEAATYLEQLGRLNQAAIELGLAVSLNPSQSSRVCAFLRRHPTAELAWLATPLDVPRERESREAAVDCLIQQRLWVEAERALLQLAERFPHSEYALRRLVTTAANQGNKSLALTRAEAMTRALPDSAVGVAGLAELLSALGRAGDALRWIDAAPAGARMTQEVLIAEATAAAQLSDEQRLESSLNRLLAAFGTTTQSRSSLMVFASQRLSIVGNHVGALSKARTAYDLSGDPNALELAHKAALEAGLVTAALRTAAELCNVGHRGRAFCGEKPTSPINASP